VIGVVAIIFDYSETGAGWELAHVLQWNFEVHQVLAAVIANPGYEERGAGQRIVEITDIEEREAGLRIAGLDGAGLETGAIDFVLIFLF
jgi:hypothetical protein